MPVPDSSSVSEPGAPQGSMWRGLLRGHLGFDGNLPFIQALRVASWVSMVLNALAAAFYLLLWGSAQWIPGALQSTQSAGVSQTDVASLLLFVVLSLAVVALDWALLVRLHLGRAGRSTLVLAWLIALIQLPVVPLGTLVALGMVPALLHPVTRRALGRAP